MTFFLLFSLVLIAAASVLFIAAVKRTVAHSQVRKGWYIISAAAVIYCVIHLILCSILSDDVAQTLNAIQPLIFGAIIFAYALQTGKTLDYFQEINSIEGVRITDPVTGAYNKTYLEQRLNSEVARSQRYGSPLSVVSVSISGHLIMQREFGHQALGIAGRKVASRLKEVLRETDVVTTLGNGRFLLILPDTPEGSVDTLITRLYGALDGMKIICGAGKEESVCINVNFGKSHCGLHTNSATELIDRAIVEEAPRQPVALSA